MSGISGRTRRHRTRDLARTNVQKQLKELYQELHLQRLTNLQLEIQMDALAELLERAGRFGKVTQKSLREEIRKQINLRAEKVKEQQKREESRSQNRPDSKGGSQSLAETGGDGESNRGGPQEGKPQMAS